MGLMRELLEAEMSNDMKLLVWLRITLLDVM